MNNKPLDVPQRFACKTGSENTSNKIEIIANEDKLMFFDSIVIE
jgi:hypothetical protein